MMAPDAVERGRKSARGGIEPRSSGAEFYFHRQTVRDIDQTPFKQLHISAPHASSQSRRNRPNSSGGRNHTSAIVGRGSGRTTTASPRPLMARKAFSSV